MSAKILLLEDDANLNDLMTEYLEDNGYKVRSYFDSKSALEILFEEHFDILVLDVKVPGRNGFAFLKEIRESDIETPAIFTTSLGTLDDLENGFKSGCDDYLKKPFELKELLFRIEAILKREFKTHDDRIEIAENIYFESKKEILSVGGKALSLPQKELELFKLLLKNRGFFVNIEKIYDEIWNLGEEPSAMSLRVYIKNLRKIIGKELIENRKNSGYRLC